MIDALRPPRLAAPRAERFGGRPGYALFSFGATALAIVVSGFAAFFSGQPLIFPSLGPTAYLFFESPTSPRASPCNTLIGHLVAILAGVLALVLFGLVDNPSVIVEGMSLARVGAAVLSTALTGAVLLLLRSPHPPAGATVLIVSLGFLQEPGEMLVLAGGVVLVTLAGWTINRASWVPAPLWFAKERGGSRDGLAIRGMGLASPTGYARLATRPSTRPIPARRARRCRSARASR